MNIKKISFRNFFINQNSKKYIIPKVIVLYIGLIFFRVLVDYSYENIIAVLFDYQNYLINPSTNSILISWLFYLSLFPLISKSFNKSSISTNIVSLLVLISLVPTTTLISYNKSYPISYILLMYLYWCILLITVNFLPTIRIFKINKSKSELIVNAVTVILILTIIAISYKHTGLRFHLNLMTVYDLREEAREFQINFFIGYLSTFADNILPILLVHYLFQKKYFYSFIVSLTIFVNFGISGTKQVLFLFFFSIISYLLINSFRPVKAFLGYFILLIIFCITEYFMIGTWFVSLFSLYRIFFIPAKLHFVYYNFFSVNELDYFRQSALKWLLESPYKINIGFLMGEEDIGEIAARANNGLFSDAYFNFGVIGIILFPIILVVILKLLDAAVKDLNGKIKFMIVITITFILLNLPITTGLISAGVLPLIFILYFIPRGIKELK